MFFESRELGIELPCQLVYLSAQTLEGTSAFTVRCLRAFLWGHLVTHCVDQEALSTSDPAGLLLCSD